MHFKWCFNPVKRSMGGRLPFKRVPQKKTRKQMQLLLHINKAFMQENEALQKMCLDGQHTIAYQDNLIQQREKTITEQEEITKKRIEGYQAKVDRDYDRIQKLEQTKRRLQRMRNEAVMEHHWDIRVIDQLIETIVVLRAVLHAEGFAVDVIRGLGGAVAQ